MPLLAPSLRHLDGSVAVVAALALPAAAADGRCVDLNTATRDQLREIIHIDEERSGQIVDRRNVRPWESVRQLTDVRGIAERRLADILDQGLACVDGDRGERR